MKIQKLLTATALTAAMVCAAGAGIPAALRANAADSDNGTYAQGTDFDVYTSSTIRDFTDSNRQAKHMLDGDLSTYWCSAWVTETTPACDEYVLFDFHEIVKVESITLTARDTGYMFPDVFEFCWSTSNEVEIPIAGASYSGYENAENNVNTFVFEEPVVARYIVMNITSRTPDEGGTHLVCIAEAAAEITEATEAEKEEAEAEDAATERPPVVNDPEIAFNLTTSSYLDDNDLWIPEHLTDGKITTQWCSEWVATANEEDEIYVTMTFGDPQRVTGVILSTQGICFPRDFVFQYTLDNEHWLDIEGASYTDYALAEGEQQPVFAFPTPQVASAIRLKVTKKTADPSGNYLVQLADVYVRGFEATEEEIASATEAFNTAIGNMPEDPNAKPTPIPATPEDFITEGGCGSSVAASGIALGSAALVAAAAIMKKKGGRQ